MSKVKYTFIDGPMAGCVPANGLSVDSSLVGLEPVAGDKRFTCIWDRTRTSGGVLQGVYKFVRGDDGQVMAVHVPEVVEKEPPANG